MQKLLCKIGLHRFTHGRCKVCGRTRCVECLIFDFGNVIGFFDHDHACKNLAAMSTHAFTSEQVHDAIFKSELEGRYDRGEISTAQFLKELRTRLFIDLTKSDDEVAESWSNIFKPNDAVVRLIAKFHEECSLRLVLASNTNELHYQRFSVQFADVLKHFDHQILSFEIGRTKPDTEFYAMCIEAAGCEASECVYIDDRQEFVEVASAAGMRGLHFEAGSNLRRKLRDVGVQLFATVNPNPIAGSAKDTAIQIYQQKYLQFRHFDTLRWQVPGLVGTQGALILTFGADKARPVLPLLLIAYGIFACLCGYFLQRITHHQELNTGALLKVARRLGDRTVPSRTSSLHPLRSAAVWFMLFVYGIGGIALAFGLGLLCADLLRQWETGK